MPESVERPAPERTTTSPSATRSASASRDPARCSTGGAAVTAPWSQPIRDRAGRSGGAEFAVEPAEDLAVHALEALRREGALEEAADAARAVPGGAHPHGGAPVARGVDGPGGDHRGVGV